MSIKPHYQNLETDSLDEIGSIRAVLDGEMKDATLREYLNDRIESEERLRFVLEGINAGFWEWNVSSGEQFWSKSYYRLLGFEPNEIESSYESFAERIHPNDRDEAAKSLEAYLRLNKPYRVEFRVKLKSGAYRWFEGSAKVFKDTKGAVVKMVGALADIHERKLLELNNVRSEFLMNEAGTISKIGAWEVDLSNSRVTWSDQVYQIHELPLGTELDVETAINFYHPDYRDSINKAIANAIEKKQEWDFEYKLITAKSREIWVRARGYPILNLEGEVIALRGVFQDIDEIKEKELHLQTSLSLLQKQNNRLLDFAHIISHNLRSHSSNIQSLVTLMSKSPTEKERAFYLEQMGEVSVRLNESMEYLNEVVRVQTRADLTYKKVYFEKVFLSISTRMEEALMSTEAELETDFEVAYVNYVPDYLQSILRNLLSNAIRFRQPNVPLEISVKTSINNKTGQTELAFADNGLGIDLEKYGAKLFGMYKTFHRHPVHVD